MAEPMTLRDEDVGRVGEHVKPWLRELVEMNARFQAVDRRFEDLIGQMSARFETVDRRFEESSRQANSHFKTLAWMIGAGFAVVTSLTTLFALLS